MRIRLLKDYYITTIYSYVNTDGKIEINNNCYNCKFGELIPTKHIVDNNDSYEIDFGSDERIKGICLKIPKDVIEFLSNEYVQPNPQERCCNHG